MFIKTNIEKRDKLKTKLHNILVKYIYKYITRLFEKEKSSHDSKTTRPSLYPDFQRSLLKIPKWSENKIDKEYHKFLKWSRKKEDLDENELYLMFINIIKLSIEIILNKSNIYVNALLENHKFPTMKEYYIKCLKRITRVVYENPKQIYNIKTSRLINELDNILQNFIPYNMINEILELQEEESIQNNIKIKYDFDKENSSISLRDNSDKILIVNKQPSEDPSLHYVSSDKLHHQYEKSDDYVNHNNSINKKISKIEEIDNNIKHIRIPIMKKNQYYYNKPRIDEIEEYFFNE
jgi:hypothetical protein